MHLTTRLVRCKHTLPDLPYDYNALEPVISAEIMRLHHQKHHNAYVTNLNIAAEKLEKAVHEDNISQQIELQSALKFNGGGHINHSIFWKNLTPVSSAIGEPEGELMKAIQKEFGTFDDFKAKFNAKAAAVQGSGWGWLGYNRESKRLEVATTANQDPLHISGLVPLLGVDVWEHAYYLQYKNVRPDYLKNIWQIINWKDIQERFAKASKD